MTDGQAPIFLASGWDTPNAPRNVPVRPTASGAPPLAAQVRFAQPSAAIMGTVPSGRMPVSRAVTQPPTRPRATRGAVLTSFAFFTVMSMGTYSTR